MLPLIPSRLCQPARRQACAPCASVGTCPPAIRQLSSLCRPARSACPIVQTPPPLFVTKAGRRGRPPPPAEESPPDELGDETFIDEEPFEYEEDEDGEFAEQLDPMSKRLVGFNDEDEDENALVDDEGEGPLPGALDDDEDDAALDEAAEADRDGAAADDVGEPSTSYPEPPQRVQRASEVFRKAILLEPALWLAANHPDLLVIGVQSNPTLVVPGDIFVLHPWQLPWDMDEDEAMATAVEQGAAVVVAPSLDSDTDPWAGVLPDDTPLLRVDNTTEAGARLARAFYDAPSTGMITVGVMGHAGKTTASWLIRGIVEELGYTVGVMTTIENAIAEDRLDEDGYLWEPLELDPSEDRECSVPFKLIPYQGKYEKFYGEALPGLNAQKILAGMRDRGAGVAVLEMSAQQIALRTFDSVEVNVAVITNLSPVRGPLSRTGADRAELDQEATELIMQTVCRKLKDAQTQLLVLNLDDPLAPELLQRLGNRVTVVTYGIENRKAQVLAEVINYNIWETESIILLKDLGQRAQVITHMLGRHNVYNVLAAFATGVALKAPVESIVAGLEAVEIPGRSEVIDDGQDFSVVVDAANDPERLEAMLEAVRLSGARQIFTVFGCSGNEDPTVRPRMGAVAHAMSDFVIVTNENPRLEDPATVVSDIVAGFPDDMINKYSAYAYFPFQDQGRTPLWFEPYLQKAQRDNKRYIMEDRYSAIRAAIGTAGTDDVILLAGKGHQDFVEHMSEEGGILKGWLDDRVEARNALSKLKYLEQIPKFQRDTLPWGSKIETLMETLVVDAGVGRSAGELGSDTV